MRNKLGAIFMVLGAVLILAALSLFLGNRTEARQAERSSAEILPLVMENIRQPVPTGQAADTAEPELPDPYDTTMTVVEIDGYGYIGYLSIPALGLELPVMSDWDYPRLRIAPCRYAGSSKADNLVIAAHNYERHFGNLAKLSPGDVVSFTDMDDVVSRYAVVAVETLAPSDVENMTAGEYDLTLFTCTYGGGSRVAVRCDRVEDGSS